MKKFLVRVFYFSILLIGGMLFTFVGVALSTQYTPKVEAIFFGLKNEWGSTYNRSKDLHDWKNVHTKKALILGTSTAYRNINPYILDSFTGYNWFNLGSSSQTIEISTTLLKQVLDSNQIDLLLIDIYGGTMSADAYESAYDWIKNADKETSTYSILKASKTDTKLISQFLYRQLKKQIPSKDFFYCEPSNGTYTGKGFVCSDKFNAMLSDTCTRKKRTMYIADKLDEIFTLCKEKNIRIIINLSPELGVDDQFYDLPKATTIIDHTELLRDSSSYHLFYDSHHMTCKGSSIYSRQLGHKISAALKSN